MTSGRRPSRVARLAAGARWLAEDSVRAVRDWRPPELPEESQRPPAPPRRRQPEPTWGRSAPAVAARRIVQGRALFPLLTALGRPEVTGAEHLLEVRPPLILAPNHASHADAPIVLQALPAPMRDRTVVPAAADYFFSRRGMSLAVTLLMNAVPFDRHNEIADSVRRTERFLRFGFNVVMFPEGTRSDDGRLRGFKAGVAHLAVHTGAPVIPVYVQGTHGLLPRGAAVPRPSAVAVHFGEPLRAADGETARGFNERLEGAVANLAAHARGFAHHDRARARRPWVSSWRASAAELGGGGEPSSQAPDAGAGPADAPRRARRGDGAAAGAAPSAPDGWIERWREATPR